MELVEIPLANLRAHPLNSNVMPEELLEKLARHMDRTGRYPPVVVRRIKREDASDIYEILDGHHRVLALRRIGAAAARCVMWEVDDAEALTLLATLNRLQGQDDPKKRARLLAQIEAVKAIDVSELARMLPERADEVRGLLALNAPPVLRPPRGLDELPVAVHFFLSRVQRAALEGRLMEIGGPREAALMRMVDSGCAVAPSPSGTGPG